MIPSPMMMDTNTIMNSKELRLPSHAWGRYHLTDLRFCCAANVVTAGEAREPDVYRDCSNRLLDGGGSITLNVKHKDIFTDPLGGVAGL